LTKERAERRRQIELKAWEIERYMQYIEKQSYEFNKNWLDIMQLQEWKTCEENNDKYEAGTSEEAVKILKRAE
jgi:hypothetical protein